MRELRFSRETRHGAADLAAIAGHFGRGSIRGRSIGLHLSRAGYTSGGTTFRS